MRSINNFLGGDKMEEKTVLFVNIRTHKVERVKPIYEAKKLGLRVALLADSVPDIDTSIIDDLIIADTFNYEKALSKVKEYHQTHPLRGVLTWSDKDVELVAKIGNQLGLPALSEKSAKLARNKYLMREAMNKVEGLCPKFQFVQTFNDLQEAASKIGFPAIFKPVGASGSKAIFRVEQDTDLNLLFKEMSEATKSSGKDIYSYYPNQYIYEEFIDGPEVSVDGLIKDNKIYIAGVTDKDVTEDYSLEYNAFFPSKHPKDVITEIKDKAIKAIKVLELNNCPFHIECRVSSKGVRILEVAARAGGGFITSHIIEYATGYSLHEQIIRAATDLDFNWPDFENNYKYYAGMIQPLADKEGILTKIDGLDLILEDEQIKYVFPIKKIGSYVKLPPKDFSPHLAYIIGKSNSYQGLVDSLEKARNKFKFEIETKEEVHEYSHS